MTGKEKAGPYAGADGTIVVRVGSEKLREELLEERDEPDFRERVNEAFALGAKALKRRMAPSRDVWFPSGEADGETKELYEILAAVNRNFNATEALNAALRSFMDSYLGYPDCGTGSVPRFLLERENGGEEGDEDDDAT